MFKLLEGKNKANNRQHKAMQSIRILDRKKAYYKIKRLMLQSKLKD